MKTIFLLFLLVGSLLANENIKKRVVIDLTTGDLETFKIHILRAIPKLKLYYESKLQELKVVVVIHGLAYKFFVKDLAHSPYLNDVKLVKANDNLVKRINAANSLYDIEFVMCEVGMEHQRLSKKEIYPFVKFVPSPSIPLIDMQHDGFAYIPVP